MLLMVPYKAQMPKRMDDSATSRFDEPTGNIAFSAWDIKEKAYDKLVQALTVFTAGLWPNPRHIFHQISFKDRTIRYLSTCV